MGLRKVGEQRPYVTSRASGEDTVDALLVLGGCETSFREVVGEHVARRFPFRCADAQAVRVEHPVHGIEPRRAAGFVVARFVNAWGMNATIPSRPSPMRPAGEEKSGWLAVLEQGANLLQQATPLAGFDVYVVGLHCAKDRPGQQMEAHHYCRVVNEDFLQCVLFDGNTADANLIGVEYIVSERLFATMPREERAYWHPHNYEILSGQLAAPGLPAVAEKALMKQLMNSYGKTWHTWHTGRHDGERGDEVPKGDAMLMWSFNRDGEADESLKLHRDDAMRLDTAGKRDHRHDLVELARPQEGVDAMRDQFSGTRPVEGVAEA